MDEMERKVIELEQREKSNSHRIDKLEGIAEAIHEQNSSIKELVSEIKRTNEHVTDHEDRLTDLERRPAQRWNTMTRTIFTTVVSTISGGIVGALIAMLIK
ncbi:hypothetical protein [Youxingia wuxianensis]|uniref:Uncharacterized protein n=1 Tax=Youxingia wuxianensis TaxID=2763678 RepID=A0A926ESF6_9FIRM|nr:hypothetical protein [Youxingia wuxianensis]MBC8586607.1 hypothetical protein [Youxingia wuxianensis]